MSWSVSCLGTPANVASYLQTYGDTLTGQSQIEYNDSKDHLVALVNQNFTSSPAGMVITINASGSGQVVDGVQTGRNCQVTMATSYTRLV